MKRKLNCWEFTKCGKEPGGANVNELGVCLIATYTQFDGINSGINGGRICWAISGTLCNGRFQGSVAEKQRYCMSCGFYKTLIAEVAGTADSLCCQ